MTSAMLSGLLYEASARGDARTVALLLQDRRADPASVPSGLLAASSSNHLAVVKLLLADGRADPWFDLGKMLILAAVNGHRDVVAALLKDRRTKTCDRALMCVAMSKDRAAFGTMHINIIHMLLADSRCTRQGQELALRQAVLYDFVLAAAALLEVVDPSVQAYPDQTRLLSNALAASRYKDSTASMLRLLLLDRRMAPRHSDLFHSYRKQFDPSCSTTALELLLADGRADLPQLSLDDMLN